MFKEKLCTTFNIKMACSAAAGAQQKPQETCTGPACCQESTCFTDMLPFMKCKDSRGPAQCVGGSLPMTKGTCQCKFGACSDQGKCPMQPQALGGAAPGGAALG